MLSLFGTQKSELMILINSKLRLFFFLQIWEHNQHELTMVILANIEGILFEIIRRNLRSSIWTPDIVLINAAGNGDEGMEKRTLVKVSFQNSPHKINFQTNLISSLFFFFNMISD